LHVNRRFRSSPLKTLPPRPDTPAAGRQTACRRPWFADTWLGHGCGDRGDRRVVGDEAAGAAEARQTVDQRMGRLGVFGTRQRPERLDRDPIELYTVDYSSKPDRVRSVCMFGF
jgi:hypothetical protein